MTHIITSIADLRKTLKPLRCEQTIALVPTMGNLHDGHLALVKQAQQRADIVVVSIFVNPTQFGENEDLDSYPRTLATDTKKLTDIGADYIFAPTIAAMYPILPPATQILTGAISQQLCGQTRPTHFDGVGLVVAKLLNIVQPNVAVFGKKDYQQLAIVRQLVQDLSYDVTIVAVPIVRAQDGLALSSRNQYLSKEERQIAPSLHQEVDRLAGRLKQGEATSVTLLRRLLDDTITSINSAGFRVDYLKVLNQDLTPVTNLATNKHLVIITAAWLGVARLLDNQEVEIA